MRNSILYIALILVLPLFILACDNNSNSINGTALTENDFVQDSALRADPEKGVIVTFLESPDSEAPEKDTGDVGVDVIPLMISQTVNYTYCWEDDDITATHFMEIRDSGGDAILTLEANGNCRTETIEPGEYVMLVHHDGSSDDTLPIFLIPEADGVQQAAKTDGIYNRFIASASDILSGLMFDLYDEARAQTVEKNIDILMSTRRCDRCFLARVGFGGVNLRGVSLQLADLTEADLRSANLTDADLASAKLPDADLSKADLSNARLTNVVLSDAFMDEAKLTGANLSLSNLKFASLRGANLRNARLEVVILNNADLSDADLTSANLTDTQLPNADLANAVLINVNFTNAFMSDVNLTGADLTNANFSDANMRFVNLTNTNLVDTLLDNTDLGRATWCDGCICERGSTDTCSGCPPIEEVCSGL